MIILFITLINLMRILIGTRFVKDGSFGYTALKDTTLKNFTRHPIDFIPNYNDTVVVKGDYRYDDYQRIRYSMRLQCADLAIL